MTDNRATVKSPPLTTRYKNLRPESTRTYAWNKMCNVLSSETTHEQNLASFCVWAKVWVLTGTDLTNESEDSREVAVAGIVDDKIIGPIKVP